MFELRIFNPGDGNYGLSDPDDPDPDTEDSTFVFDDQSRQKIRAGLELWADILILSPSHIPGIINLGSFDDENAYAFSPPVPNPQHPDQPLLSFLQAALLYELDDDQKNTPHAVIGIGTFAFDTDDITPSQLPITGAVDYVSTVYHEMAHALGIANNVSDKMGEATPYYDDELTRWTVGLRDDNGNPARPNQAVLCVPCNNAYDPDAFDLRKDQGYFTGVHVQEVLNGAMPGIPVSILYSHDNPQYGVDNNYMSHTELRNSMMSHQSYQNYTILMEAEIAALQDIGWQIDRRNLFGYSVYGDDVTLTNNNGFFARNEEGTAYLPGQYNSATQGLGLHVYGERNTITQAADLLTAGPGGIGVRVDGSENTVIVPTATRIHAQGWHGRGLQFSYGRHHNLIQQGEVRADGEEGIAVLFDFGSNALGDEDEYRGSWLLEKTAK